MLILRPIGRGNWTPLIVAVEGKRAAPMLVHLNNRLPIGGVVYRVAKVLP
jgi:hypothetical protein